MDLFRALGRPERPSGRAPADRPRRPGPTRRLDFEMHVVHEGSSAAAVAEAEEFHDKLSTELNGSDGDGAAPLEYVPLGSVEEPEPEPEPEPSPALIVEEEPLPEVVQLEELEEDLAAVEHEQNSPVDPESSLVDEHLKTPEEVKAEYQARFPPAPEAPAATTYGLFRDPEAFSASAVEETTHHLTSQIRGELWLDADADAKRGSLADPALNAMEYDVGVGGVQVQLVSCDANEPAGLKTSLPNVGGEASSMKRSDVPEAGRYEFPIDARTVPGRYYVMYKAPTDYRVSGNVLPLERKCTDEGGYCDCVPRGGEGYDYLEDVAEGGDLDLPGYCARSIGCIEVGTRSALESKFDRLVPLEEGGAEGAVDLEEDPDKLLVALPSTHVLNVGLSEDPWPLSTFQFADSQVTLTFPATVSAEDLTGAVPEDFSRSSVKRILETTLARQFAADSGEGTFTIQGVELLEGVITVPEVESQQEQSGQESETEEEILAQEMEELEEALEDSAALAVEESKSDLPAARGLRGLQDEAAAAQAGAKHEDAATETTPSLEDVPAVAQVTYTLTARGTYRPPPRLQLGEILQESINRDPTKLVRTLKDKEAVQELPPVFEDVVTVEARHLKVEPPSLPPGGGVEAYEDLLNQATIRASEARGGMARWAVAPVAMLSLSIAALAGAFLARRIFVRRRRASEDYWTAFCKGGLKEGVAKGLLDFKTSKFRPEDDEKRKSDDLDLSVEATDSEAKGKKKKQRKDSLADLVAGGEYEIETIDEEKTSDTESSHESPPSARWDTGGGDVRNRSSRHREEEKERSHDEEKDEEREECRRRRKAKHREGSRRRHPSDEDAAEDKAEDEEEAKEEEDKEERRRRRRREGRSRDPEGPGGKDLDASEGARSERRRRRRKKSASRRREGDGEGGSRSRSADEVV
ncbi:hypothetical protein ACHAWF_005955 [Thalassiosira exigua]